MQLQPDLVSSFYVTVTISPRTSCPSTRVLSDAVAIYVYWCTTSRLVRHQMEMTFCLLDSHLLPTNRVPLWGTRNARRDLGMFLMLIVHSSTAEMWTRMSGLAADRSFFLASTMCTSMRLSPTRVTLPFDPMLRRRPLRL